MQLPDFVIADLYKNVLVDIAPQQTVREPVITKQVTANTPPETTGDVRYLGKNGKNICIVLADSDVQHIRDEDLSFLTAILQACSLNLADIAVVNNANMPLEFSQLEKHLSPQHLMLFGVLPSALKLPFNIPYFQMKRHGECSVLTIPPISDLNKPTEEAKLLKTRLWMSLKNIFGIK